MQKQHEESNLKTSIYKENYKILRDENEALRNENEELRKEII